MTEQAVINGTESSLQVVLAGGQPEHFEKAVAELKEGGHLVVRNNVLYDNTKVVAIFAPGAWLRVQLPPSAR